MRDGSNYSGQVVLQRDIRDSVGHVVASVCPGDKILSNYSKFPSGIVYLTAKSSKSLWLKAFLITRKVCLGLKIALIMSTIRHIVLKKKKQG